MTERGILEPKPDQPVAIEPTAARLRVYSAGRVVADTTKALTMREAAYPPVFYVPCGCGHVTPHAERTERLHHLLPLQGRCLLQGIRQPDGSVLDNPDGSVLDNPDGSVLDNKVWFYGAPTPPSL
jgi:uncharacterized protein (DUF427 family)